MATCVVPSLPMFYGNSPSDHTSKPDDEAELRDQLLILVGVYLRQQQLQQQQQQQQLQSERSLEAVVQELRANGKGVREEDVEHVLLVLMGKHVVSDDTFEGLLELLSTANVSVSLILAVAQLLVSLSPDTLALSKSASLLRLTQLSEAMQLMLFADWHDVQSAFDSVQTSASEVAAAADEASSLVHTPQKTLHYAIQADAWLWFLTALGRNRIGSCEFWRSAMELVLWLGETVLIHDRFHCGFYSALPLSATAAVLQVEVKFHPATALFSCVYTVSRNDLLLSPPTKSSPAEQTISSGGGAGSNDDGSATGHSSRFVGGGGGWGVGSNVAEIVRASRLLKTLAEVAGLKCWVAGRPECGGRGQHDDHVASSTDEGVIHMRSWFAAAVTEVLFPHQQSSTLAIPPQLEPGLFASLVLLGEPINLLHSRACYWTLRALRLVIRMQPPRLLLPPSAVTWNHLCKLLGSHQLPWVANSPASTWSIVFHTLRLLDVLCRNSNREHAEMCRRSGICLVLGFLSLTCCVVNVAIKFDDDDDDGREALARISPHDSHRPATEQIACLHKMIDDLLLRCCPPTVYSSLLKSEAWFSEMHESIGWKSTLRGEAPQCRHELPVYYLESNLSRAASVYCHLDTTTLQTLLEPHVACAIDSALTAIRKSGPMCVRDGGWDFFRRTCKQVVCGVECPVGGPRPASVPAATTSTTTSTQARTTTQASAPIPQLCDWTLGGEAQLISFVQARGVALNCGPLWFHGTTAHAARNIVNRGVIVAVVGSSTRSHDFGGTASNWPAFYIGDRLDRAVNWAHVRTAPGNDCAVVVFRTPNLFQSTEHHPLQDSDFPSLATAAASDRSSHPVRHVSDSDAHRYHIFRAASPQWRTYVTLSRDVHRDEPDYQEDTRMEALAEAWERDTGKNLCDIEYVQGPVARWESDTMQWVAFERFQQIGVKTQQRANELEIACIVYFSRRDDSELATGGGGVGGDRGFGARGGGGGAADRPGADIGLVRGSVDRGGFRV